MPATIAEAEHAPVVTHSLAVLDTGAANLRVWLFDAPSTPSALKAAANGALHDLQAVASDVLVLPNVVARPRVTGAASKPTIGGASRSYLAGPEIGEQIGVYARLQLRSPIERGFITDWAAQTLSWSTTLQQAHSLKEQKAVAASADGTLKNDRRSDAASGKRTRRAVAHGASELSPPEDKDKAESSISRRKSSSRGILGTAEMNVGQPWLGPGPAPLLWGRTVLVTEPYFNMPELASAMDTLLFEEYGAAAVLRASPAELAAWCLRVPPAMGITNIVREVPISASDDEPVSVQDAEIHPVPDEGGASQGTRATTGKRKLPQAEHATNVAATLEALPEATLVLDCGHSYCHAVPLVRGRVVWGAVKRLDFGGKHVTNLLKTSLSFGQWDLSEDTWLVGKVKERTAFVAASAGQSQRRQARAVAQSILDQSPAPVPPHRWSFATLTEMSKLASSTACHNPIALEYILPDYSAPSPGPPSTSAPGQQEMTRETEIVSSPRVKPLSRSSNNPTPLDLEHVDEATFSVRYGKVLSSEAIKREQLPLSAKAWLQSERDAFICPTQLLTAANERISTFTEDPDDEAQTLRLTTDRFVHTEAFFAPTRIPGLGHPFPEQLGLAQLAFAAAQEAEELVLYRELRQKKRNAANRDGRDKGSGTGLLLANVLLVGGGACVPGLPERLEHELRPLAPEATPVRVRVPLNPISAAAEGGAAFLLIALAGLYLSLSSSATSRHASRPNSDLSWQLQALTALPGRFTSRQAYLDRAKGT